MRHLAKATAIAIVAAFVGVGLLLWVQSANPRSAMMPISLCRDGAVGGIASLRRFLGSDDCLRFDPPQEFSGIYLDEFEGSIFLNNRRPSSKYKVAGRATWLNFAPASDAGPLVSDPEIARVWYIHFVGRRTSDIGPYGHLGGSCAEIIVDRVISAQLIGQGDGYLSDELIDFGNDWSKCDR